MDDAPYPDDEVGRDPNGARSAPLAGDAGFTVRLEGGPLHGREGRLRDSDFRLWYAVDHDGRPLVWSGRRSPRLEPRQHLVGYYAFNFEAETVMTWTPAREGLGLPRWFAPLIALCAMISTAAIVSLALRSPAGRWVKYAEDGTALLDTQEGRICALVSPDATSRCLVARH